MDLTGQTVLIIGGSSGMGLAAAQLAGKLGSQAIVAGHNRDKNQAALAQLSPGTRSAYVDVTDHQSIEALFAASGPLDHLFVTAAPGGKNDFAQTSLRIEETYLYGKFWSLVMLMQAARSRIRKDGSVTFVTGGLAVRPEKGAVLVTAAFGAVEGFAKALAVEWAPLRFNVIRPGLIDSGFWDYLGEEKKRQLMEETVGKIPAGRKGESEDVGRLAVSLMMYDYVNGQVIEVNGGQLLQ
jgi:NAD(P)-dependent dehydrogenase (short-subunit alcohol dehydrogenase family)